nr:uncharacterized protein LOC123573092 [Macaca fascicularis]
MGFEPTRAEHNGLAVHRLNHSATSSHEELTTCFFLCVVLPIPVYVTYQKPDCVVIDQSMINQQQVRTRFFTKIRGAQPPQWRSSWLCGTKLFENRKPLLGPSFPNINPKAVKRNLLSEQLRSALGISGGFRTTLLRAAARSEEGVGLIISSTRCPAALPLAATSASTQISCPCSQPRGSRGPSPDHRLLENYMSLHTRRIKPRRN